MPLEINTTGTSTLTHAAERALLRIAITSNGPAQQVVTAAVTQTAAQLQVDLKVLSSTSGAADSSKPPPITHWSMSSLWTSTSTAISTTEKDADGNWLRIRSFMATTTFDIRFSDFEKLGAACTDLSSMPHVQIRGIEWKVTDKMLAKLEGLTRKLAVEDAVRKAKDYSEAALGKRDVVPVLIDDDTHHGNPTLFGGGGAQPRAGGLFGGAGAWTGQGSEVLSFEPEEVKVSSSVRMKFEVAS